MAQCEAHILTQATCVLIVVSTYGDGEPPDDAALFWHAVVQAAAWTSAASNFPCSRSATRGRELDAALERQGATRPYPRVDCDVPAKRWMAGVLASLRQEQNLSAWSGAR
jgi:sulfite reductase (NADPH) flavoprotein alpha-component